MSKICDTTASRKGRPPVGKKAMSAVERQRRRRKKLARQALANMRNSERRKKQLGVYIPMPPGITYWRYVEVRLEDGSSKRIATPETKPLAACERCLDDRDVIALLQRLGTTARANGTPVIDYGEVKAKFGAAAATEWLRRERAEAASRYELAERLRKSRDAMIFFRVQMAIRQAQRAAANLPTHRARAKRQPGIKAAPRRAVRRTGCHGHDPGDPGEPAAASIAAVSSIDEEAS